MGVRWYKIDNTSKKKLYFKSNWETEYISNARTIKVFNSKGKLIETVKNGAKNKICTKTKVPKGTYYVCVHSTYPSVDWEYAFGNVITLKWN